MDVARNGLNPEAPRKRRTRDGGQKEITPVAGLGEQAQGADECGVSAGEVGDAGTALK